MNHDLSTGAAESRVLNVYMSTVGSNCLIVSAVHTVAINEGDTLTWAGKFGDQYHVKVVEAEWSIFNDDEPYVCTALCEIISWY